jgi:radical SAM-linked protein
MIQSNKIRVQYEKGDPVRFLGHLDVSRVIHMSVRRARWPVKMTEGFSPKMKISFYSPLPVGTAGKAEYFDAEMTVDIKTKDMKDLASVLEKALPSGFKVKSLGLVPGNLGSLEKMIKASEYIIDMAGVCHDLIKEDLTGFMSEKRVRFKVNRGNQTKKIDVRPYLMLARANPRGDGVIINMKIKHDNGRTVRPQWILSVLAGAGKVFDPLEAIVDRTRIIFRSEGLP